LCYRKRREGTVESKKCLLECNVMFRSEKTLSDLVLPEKVSARVVADEIQGEMRDLLHRQELLPKPHSWFYSSLLYSPSFAVDRV
jgi:hypothetical protein